MGFWELTDVFLVLKLEINITKENSQDKESAKKS